MKYKKVLIVNSKEINVLDEALKLYLEHVSKMDPPSINKTWKGYINRVKHIAGIIAAIKSGSDEKLHELYKEFKEEEEK